MIDPIKELPKRFSKKLSEDHKNIYTGMVRVLNTYVIDFMQMNIRYFTRHGRNHSENIIKVLDNLLYNEILEKMTSAELLILLCSAWLHDIGLMVNRDENDKELEDKEIRERHHELSKYYILKEEIYSTIGFDDRLFITAVAEVCYWHSRKAGRIDNIFEKMTIFGEFVHLRFLAGLFRLADALDIGSERTPILLFHDLAVLPETSSIHWRASGLMDIGYDMEKKLICVTCLYEDNEETEMVSWKFYDLCDEFKDVKKYLKIGDNESIWKEIEGTLICRKTMDECKLNPNEVDKELKPIELLICEKNKDLHEKNEEYLFAADWCSTAIHFLEKYQEDHQYVLDLSLEFKKDLGDTCTNLSEDLKNALNDNSLPVSEKAKLSRLRNNEWIILDNEEKYLIRKSGNKLRIYSLHKRDARIESTRNRIKDYYEKILEYYEKERNKENNKDFMPHFYFLRSFERYYLLKYEKFCAKDLSCEDERFLDDMETIWKYLDAIEARVFYGESYLPLSILLKSGRSPLRERTKKRLTSCIEEDIILDDGDLRYSVHNGCCECTARLVSTLALMGKTLRKVLEGNTHRKVLEYDIQESVKWLERQGGEKKYSAINDRQRGIEYTHVVLEAFTINRAMDAAEKAFETIIKERWETESFPEGSIIENLSKAMYAISMYFQNVMHESPGERKKCKKKIENLLKRRKVIDILEGFMNKSYSEWEQYPLLDGLIGIVLLKSLIGEPYDEELNLAGNVADLIREDPVIQDPKYLWTMRMAVLVSLTYGWLLYLEAREYFNRSERRIMETNESG